MAESIKDMLPVLVQWNAAYRAGAEEVSDAVYDAKWDKLKAAVELAERFSSSDPLVGDARDFLDMVWGDEIDPEEELAATSFKKHIHTVPMESQNKSKNEQEFRDWWAGLMAMPGATGTVVGSLKLDGFSLAEYVENGALTGGVTRGKKDPKTDKMVGVDITDNVKLMKGVVPNIPGFTGFVRAETVLLKPDWKAHFPTMTNPRNGAVGVAKREGPDRADCQHLTVMAYEIRRTTGTPIPTKEAEFKILEKLGFIVAPWKVFTDVEDAIAWHKEYQDGKRQALDFDIDGIVFEENSRPVLYDLGSSGRGPVASTAFKFVADSAETTLVDLVNQVGSTGIVTPVALFEEVVLSGASVRRATLATWGIIGDLLQGSGNQCFAVGDLIRVSRRGDVIPKVEKFIRRPAGNPKLLVMPTDCPSCGGNLNMVGAFLKCEGDNCPAQTAGLLDRWTAKLGVLGWGDGLIVPLHEAGLLKEPADLYMLNLTKAAAVRDSNGTRLGRKVEIAHANLMKETVLPLHTFIGSLGIPMMARSMCRKLVDAGFNTLAKMEAATEAEIAAIPGVGPSKAREFVKGLVDREDIISHLLIAGITISDPVVGSLSGMTFCFTGFRNGDLERAIEAAGGTMSSGVSKTLTYLVAGDKLGTSGKMKKAVSYGCTILDPDEAWALVETSFASNETVAEIGASFRSSP